jgi:hypothetical protein
MRFQFGSFQLDDLLFVLTDPEGTSPGVPGAAA